MHFSQYWYIAAKRNLIVDYLLSLMFINLPINFPRWLYHAYPTFGRLFLKHFVAGLRNMYSFCIVDSSILNVAQPLYSFLVQWKSVPLKSTCIITYGIYWYIVSCIYKEKVSKNLLIIKLDSYHVWDLHTCETRKILHT